jgi:YVTN family beta-propeller protein
MRAALQVSSRFEDRPRGQVRTLAALPLRNPFSPDGRYGAVSNSGSDDSSIIDTRTRREVARVKVGKAPKRLLAVTVP